MELKLYCNENRELFLIVTSNQGTINHFIGDLRPILSDLRHENKLKDSDYLILKSPNKWTLNTVKTLLRVLLVKTFKKDRISKKDMLMLLNSDINIKWRSEK